MGFCPPTPFEDLCSCIDEMSISELRDLLAGTLVEYHLLKRENRRLADEQDRLQEKFNEQINSISPN